MAVLIKRNSTNRKIVLEIQKFLKILADGYFGPKTEQAVVAWQSENNLVADGIVGKKTLEAMGILDSDLTSDIVTQEGLIIKSYHLPENEYITQDLPILNDYVMLHHTAGHDNPYAVIDSWGKDSIGRIGTEFVIGGRNVKTGRNDHDGVVLQSFPEGSQAYHIGRSGSHYMNRHTVGIELCNMGYIENGKTYVGGTADPTETVRLSEPFRGHQRWHKYSDEQLVALKKLILHVALRDNIDITLGLIEWIKKDGPLKAFEYRENAFNGKVKGLLSHTNVRKDKFDVFPQQELIDMLLSL
jgi:hypothetical protein